MEYFFIELFKIVITAPGALFVWLYYRVTGNKRSFSEVLNKDLAVSSFLGFILIAASVLFARQLF